MEYFPSDSIDKKKWDAMLESCPAALIFDQSWYLDNVGKWGAFIQGDYETAIPIALDTKYIFNYAYQPYFTRAFRLLTKAQKNTSLSLTNYLSEKLDYVNLCIEGEITDAEKYQCTERCYQALSLNDDYNTLAKNYSNNHLRNIKKAKNSDYIVISDYDWTQVLADFEKNKNADAELLNTYALELLGKIMQQCIERNMGKAYALKDSSGIIMASAFFMFYKNRIIYLKGSSSDEGRSRSAMHLIFDAIITEYSEKLWILDFGGSSVAGVARFFKGFGATDHKYLQIKQNNLPFFLKWIKK